MKGRFVVITVLLSILSTRASAQFYTMGSDPASIRWNSIESNSYRIIYPAGTDSLARVYASRLEFWKPYVGATVGHNPGEQIRGLQRVIVHGFDSFANGTVVWAPKRLEIFSLPQAYGASAMPWTDMLAIHEQRHLAQMQFGYTHALRPFHFLLGEMFPGACVGVYTNKMFLEGDAVVTETALTRAGRGREASFLNWYRIAFDQGDVRNLACWRGGCQGLYSPDHYELGYTLLAGIRVKYDCPDFMARLEERASLRPYDVFGVRHSTKAVTGMGLNRAFDSIAVEWKSRWTAEIESRSPFMTSQAVIETPGRYTAYNGSTVTGKGIFAVRKSLDRSHELVFLGQNDIDESENREVSIRPFAYSSSRLESDGDGRLWWSEPVQDPRWEHRSWSVIRYMVPDSGNRPQTLVRGRWLYNPSHRGDSLTRGCIAAAEYFPDGRTALTLFELSSSESGSCQDALHIIEEHTIPAPDTLQTVMPAWSGEQLYATAISENGYGIYHIDPVTGRWEVILAPQPVVIDELHGNCCGNGSDGHVLLFASDHGGSNELYSLNLENGEVARLTSSRYGASDYRFSPDGKWLYYNCFCHDGAIPSRTPSDSLIHHPTDWTKPCSWPFADELSAQENKPEHAASTVITAARPYHKTGHLLNIHSWAPVYADVDNIMNFSYDKVYELASAGASVYSQNELGTAVLCAGYSAHRDPDGPLQDHMKGINRPWEALWSSRNTGTYANAAVPAAKAGWRHSAHMKFTYTGLYPVFEFKLDLGDRQAHLYSPVSSYTLLPPETITQVSGYGPFGRTRQHKTLVRPAAITTTMSTTRLDVPYVNTQLSVYVPLKWSAGGWLYGAVPKAAISASNDIWSTSLTEILNVDGLDGRTVSKEIVSYKSGGRTYRKTVSTSLRAYFMRVTADQGIYPKWGLGAEAGTVTNSAAQTLYSPKAYAYLYGYVPGIIPSHGLKLTFKYQMALSDETVFPSSAVTTVPRGLTAQSLLREYVDGRSSGTILMTADYAMPVSFRNLELLRGVFHVRKMDLVPHVDCGLFSGSVASTSGKGCLMTAGTDVILYFTQFCGIPFSFNAGVSANYNCGPSFRDLESRGVPMNRFYFGPVVSVGL